MAPPLRVPYCRQCDNLRLVGCYCNYPSFLDYVRLRWYGIGERYWSDLDEILFRLTFSLAPDDLRNFFELMEGRPLNGRVLRKRNGDWLTEQVK